MNLSRRRILTALALAPLLPATSAWSFDPTLKDTLEKGLKCRKPEEFRFIERVVALVKVKRLPQDLVLSTFQWARDQRPHFPFPYFQTGLRARALKLGIEV